MNTELQARFLFYLCRRNKNHGFTLVELMVVIIIIGILSALALPSFLNQANKAKEAEARQYIGAMNRSQQAYFLENAQFATDFGPLGVGIKTDSTNYTYGIDTTAGGTTNIIRDVAYPKNTNALRAYTGAVETDISNNQSTTLAILCQSQKPAAGSPTGVSTNTAINVLSTCAAGWETLN